MTLHPYIVEALELGERYPLARWQTWTEGPHGTSQRRAIATLVNHITILLWGGNKSGKTDFNLVCALAYALGGDHPAVQSFLRLNDLPPDLIPEGPGRVWLLAPRHTDSIRIHRSRVEHFVKGAKLKWSNKDATQEASLKIWVPDHAKPAEVWFKAHKQGLDGMKGDSIRYLGVDEQCPEPMLNQALIRLSEEAKGRCVFSMTHDVHSGISWVKTRFIDRKEPGAAEVSIDVRDNPHTAKGVIEQRIAGMTKAEQEAALTGAFGFATGRVFPDFRRGVHVRPSRPIPDDWPRYGGVDFGWTPQHPSVFLWAAVNPDGILIFYRELYRAKMRIREFGELVKAICEENDEYLNMTFSDPTAIQSMHDFGHALGMPVTKNEPRNVQLGILSFNARLGDTPPTVLFYDDCAKYLNEIPGYRRNAKGDIIKKKDHGCDAGRYIVRGVDNDADEGGDWGSGVDLSQLEQENPWEL